MRAITTLEANCQDCHRCMRECPVKAIGIEGGQTRLIDEKCVLCGRCVVECPQQAKQAADRLPIVKEAIAGGRQVILSLAPSFAAVFDEYTPQQLWGRLLELGFNLVEETAVGAAVVAQAYGDMLRARKRPIISACCPVVVNTVKKYYPQLIDNLAAVVSPVEAHARLLKERFGRDALVVFAGPCIAKIDESYAPDSRIDAVITFEQLKKWLQEAGPAGGSLPVSAALEAAYGARCFPVVGGVLKSFTRSEYTDRSIIAVDGLNKCMKFFDALARGEIAPDFVEAMACDGGCIEGPASGTDKFSPAKRLRVLEFAGQGQPMDIQVPAGVNLQRIHVAAPVQEVLPSEKEIRLVLQQTGKITAKDEKNCGACGFNSCREKAIAVCQGLTTTDTCVPYMRSKAESLANIIVDHSLNAIVVANERMIIQDFNPAAEKMFGCPKEHIRGRHLSEIMDCAHIAAAYRTNTKFTDHRMEVNNGSVVINQWAIPLVEHDLIIIVMTDVTAQENNAQELVLLKQQTVDKASEIINKQMQVAQEIAGLLGETTAETKAALVELVALLKTKGEI